MGKDRKLIRIFIFQQIIREKREQRIQYAVEQWLGRPVHAEEYAVGREKSGRPFFLHHPELYLSISDSGEFWSVALSDHRIGIDLQACRLSGKKNTPQERCGKIAARRFHPEEYAWIMQEGTADCVRFFSVWTAKEAYVKYMGTGIDDQFGTFSVCSGSMPCWLKHLQFGPFDGAEKDADWASLEQYCFCLAAEQEDEYSISYCKEKTPKIRCVAFDLDHTVLEDADHLSEKNRCAADDLIRAGCTVIPASGRPMQSMPESILHIPGIRYVITSNGAVITDLQKKQCVRELFLPEEAVQKLARICEKEQLCCEVFIRGQAYASEELYVHPEAHGISIPYLAYIRKTRTAVREMPSFLLQHKAEIQGIDLIIGDSEQYRNMREKVKKELPELYVTASVSNRIELSHPDSGKDAALRFLLQKLEISAEETAAFGDADNDRDMLQMAAYGIAMGNATDSCRSSARYVTKSCREDGFAWAVRNLLGFRETGLSSAQTEADWQFMREAVREAEKAAALEEVPIGCVIVRDGEILARGYNRRNTDQNTLSHAELNAIREASQKTGDWRLEGCTMYVTLEPCQMCSGALVQSRIDAVVIGCMNPKAGCAGSILNILQMPAFNHQVEIRRGVRESECKELLSLFFARMREKKKHRDMGEK